MSRVKEWHEQSSRDRAEPGSRGCGCAVKSGLARDQHALTLRFRPELNHINLVIMRIREEAGDALDA